MMRRFVPILTALAALSAAGSAEAQRIQFGPRGGGGGGGLFLLMNPSVQMELKLTDQQKTQLQAVMQGQLQALQGLRDLTPEQRQQKVEQIRQDAQKQIDPILTADQKKRLHQIELQQEGGNALRRPEVGKELNLTPDQVQKIQVVFQEQRQALVQLNAQLRDPNQRQAAIEKIQALRKQTDEKAFAVLTDEQRARWKEMVGAPFQLQPGIGRFRRPIPG